jgi:hypothetical protein
MFRYVSVFAIAIHLCGCLPANGDGFVASETDAGSISIGNIYSSVPDSCNKEGQIISVDTSKKESTVRVATENVPNIKTYVCHDGVFVEDNTYLSQIGNDDKLDSGAAIIDSTTIDGNTIIFNPQPSTIAEFGMPSGTNYIGDWVCGRNDDRYGLWWSGSVSLSFKSTDVRCVNLITKAIISMDMCATLENPNNTDGNVDFSCSNSVNINCNIYSAKNSIGNFAGSAFIYSRTDISPYSNPGNGYSSGAEKYTGYTSYYQHCSLSDGGKPKKLTPYGSDYPNLTQYHCRFDFLISSDPVVALLGIDAGLSTVGVKCSNTINGTVSKALTGCKYPTSFDDGRFNTTCDNEYKMHCYTPGSTVFNRFRDAICNVSM